jgi:type IV pilus assembly protein PilY1
MNVLVRKMALTATLLVFPLVAAGDAIELFAGLPVTAADAPNVVLVLDNAADFSASVSDRRCNIDASGIVRTDGTGLAADFTPLDGQSAAVQQCALYSVIKALSETADAKVNLAIMGFNDTGVQQFNPGTNSFSNDCADNTGGCLLMPLTPINATTGPAILNYVRQWRSSGSSGGHNVKTNNRANGAVMQESWAYLFGKTGISGRNYSGMVPSGTCAKNYVIFVGNAYRNNSNPGDQTNDANSPKMALEGTTLNANKRANPAATSTQRTLIGGTVSGQCGTTGLETGNNAENRGAYALNWARYMRQSHAVTTYSVGVLGPTCTARYYANLSTLGSREVGGGKFFATDDFEELKLALETIFSEILSVNTAFASVSLPVSVNTQGSFLNQVYVGMFRPDGDFLPRWIGNLKQYRLGRINDDGDLGLLDAQEPGQNAISAAGTGFIAECARSYWTPTTADSYWTPLDGTSPSCLGAAPQSNTPDGNMVEKGGQGYRLRASAVGSRNLLTCTTAGPGACSLSLFNTTNTGITAAALGAANATERTTLIEWARGLNNKAGDETFVVSTAMRPSVHSDVVHSRPVALNFGGDALNARQVVVVYGGNDGILRAINGNRDGSPLIGGVAPGGELWGFMAPESFANIKRQRDNVTPVAFRGGSAAAQPKPYGFDGPVVAERLNANEARIYATMRRGGRMLYAFSFSITAPSAPTLLWRTGCPANFNADGTVSDVGCAVGLEGIGQTWSAPTVVSAPAAGGTFAPYLIMGGGYDVCEDNEGTTTNHSCGASGKGRAVYVLNASTGALLKTLPTDRAVVGEVTIDTDANGRARYAWAADTGGNVYRINIGTNLPTAWTITKIASLGCDGTAPCNPNRKFLFGPDVVNDLDPVSGDGTYYVLIGSGDREKPISAYPVTASVENHFFAIKDNPSDPAWFDSEIVDCDAPLACLDSLFQIETGDPSPDAMALAETKGWYLSTRATEQVVTSAITLFGVVTFSTHMPAVYPTDPDGDICSPNLGTASVYNIRFRDAQTYRDSELPRFQEVVGGGLPPSPVAGRVILDDGTTEYFVIGSDPSSPLTTAPTPPAPPGEGPDRPMSRVYWHIQP